MNSGLLHALGSFSSSSFLNCPYGSEHDFTIYSRVSPWACPISVIHCYSVCSDSFSLDKLDIKKDGFFLSFSLLPSPPKG